VKINYEMEVNDTEDAGFNEDDEPKNQRIMPYLEEEKVDDDMLSYIQNDC
jgi:hypothetical protein